MCKSIIQYNCQPYLQLKIATGSARPEVRGTAEPHGGAYPP